MNNIIDFIKQYGFVLLIATLTLVLGLMVALS
jgi:hypothetical protein